MSKLWCLRKPAVAAKRRQSALFAPTNECTKKPIFAFSKTWDGQHSIQLRLPSGWPHCASSLSSLWSSPARGYAFVAQDMHTIHTTASCILINVVRKECLPKRPHCGIEISFALFCLLRSTKPSVQAQGISLSICHTQRHWNSGT